MAWWEGLERTLRTLLRAPARVHPPDLDALRAAFDPVGAIPLDEPAGIGRLAFAPDGSSLALGLRSGEVRIVPAGRAVEPRRFAGLAGGVAALGWVPRDPTLLAAAAGDGEVRLLTTELPTRLWAVRGPPATALACAPDGRRVALAGADGRVRVLSLAGGREEAAVRLSDRALVAVAWAPDGAVVAGLDAGGRLALGPWRGSGPVRVVATHRGAGFCLVLSEDGTVAYSVGADRRLAVCRAADAGLLATFDLGPGAPTALAAVPGGEFLLVGFAGGAVEVRDVVGGRVRIRVEAGPGPVAALAVAPDGTRLAVATLAGGYIGSLRPSPVTRA